MLLFVAYFIAGHWTNSNIHPFLYEIALWLLLSTCLYLVIASMTAFGILFYFSPAMQSMMLLINVLMTTCESFLSLSLNITI